MPEYIEAADHLMLYSVSGVSSLLLSNSDVNDGTAVPAVYNNRCQHASSSNFNDATQVLLVHSGRFIRSCPYTRSHAWEWQE